jgi:hypothetical protein
MATRLRFPVTGFAVVAVLAATGCRSSRSTPADDPVCRCTPGNSSRTKLSDGTYLDGPALVAKLRYHRQAVEQNRTPRDIKVFDDELRMAIIGYCQPCGDWIQDRLTIEDMFPLQRLDDAASAVCLGLVLHDGTTVYGNARPPACR